MIALEGVKVFYDRDTAEPVPALGGVSLTVTGRTLLGVVGAAGSGKTTLLQVMAGLIVPSVGTVRIDTEEPASGALSDAGEHLAVGLVFQFPERQLFESTVYDDVAFGPRNLRLDEDRVAERVREALTEVGLNPEQMGARFPMGLSFGEMRRVALAGVLAVRPGILLLDEPTAGLDQPGKRDLQRLLHRLHARGIGIVVASHDIAFLMDSVPELVVLKAGRAVARGSPLALLGDLERASDLGIAVPFAAELLSALARRGCSIPLKSLAEADLVEGLLQAARKS